MAEVIIDGDGPEAVFKAYLAQGRFMLQRLRASGEFVFYPRAAAPGTGDSDLEWVEASGAGIVYATTCTRRPTDKGGDYNVALIDLAEGPRMMSRVEGIEPEHVRIGMKVKAHAGSLNGEAAVIFTPAS